MVKVNLVVVGKVKEKYPQHLQTYHDIVSRQSTIIKQLHEKENFKIHALNIKDTYELQVDNYIFKVPQTPEEMLDEATQQSNCLAGYINKFSEGRTNIIFMRHAKEPEKSLVTIEVLNDRITQAYMASNRYPTPELKRIIGRYANKLKIQYND